MDSFRQDVRYAVRGLASSPGFTALTVLCLALGVGINSTVFSIVDNVSLQPLPFDDAERLVVLYSMQPRQRRARPGLVSGLSRLEGTGPDLSMMSPPMPTGACRSPRASSQSASRDRRSPGICFRCSASMRFWAATLPKKTTGQARRRW